MNKGKKLKSKVREKKTRPTQKEKDKEAEIQHNISTEEKPPGPKPKKEKPPAKKDTRAFEQLGCMCCSKKLWVKNEADQLVPGCSCALYLPGHTKCGKCSLHCQCEGRVHG